MESIKKSIERLSLQKAVIASTIVHVILILIGEYMDKIMTAGQYTDTDYWVFTDAAYQVTIGKSPYNRATYRYTPILAYLLTPNIYLFKSFGKYLFSAFDILNGCLIFYILRNRQVKYDQALKYSLLWFFNPLVINISTRGNADAIVCSCVFLSIWLLQYRHLWLSALAYGFSVHMKIYPIIFAPAFLMVLDENYRKKHDKGTNFITRFINKERIQFSLISGGLFLGLIALFYIRYGYEFLFESYLYHATRTDNRHNYSVYFYELYLLYNSPSRKLLGLVAFLPQIILLPYSGFKFGTDLPFAMLIETFIFVCFNKVCTAQYFLWWISFVPLVLPFSSITMTKLILLFSFYFGTQMIWNYYGFYLEFVGINTFKSLWMAGIAFFISGVYFIHVFIQKQKYTHLFSDSWKTISLTPTTNPSS
ncbi:hypothetical protein WA158_001106 [Blastocystis sp. Blastoise]